uniref:Uncharacterized protein n=1 Tax=Anguilla anguilla TaxID=7936 RepID=A0A0E9TBM7_ANGAN
MPITAVFRFASSLQVSLCHLSALGNHSSSVGLSIK